MRCMGIVSGLVPKLSHMLPPANLGDGGAHAHSIPLGATGVCSLPRCRQNKGAHLSDRVGACNDLHELLGDLSLARAVHLLLKVLLELLGVVGGGLHSSHA